MKIKISERATRARNELLLQNVSTRVWQNFVAFSSVVIRQDFFIEGPVCSRSGSNGLKGNLLNNPSKDYVHV